SAGTFAADPNLAEPAVVQDPAGSVGVDFEPGTRESVGRRRKALGRCRQVAVIALRAVGPEQEASPCEQGKPEQDSDAAENYQDDTARAHRFRTTSAERSRAALHATRDLVATGQTTAKMTPRLPHGTHVVKGAANPGGLNA